MSSCNAYKAIFPSESNENLTSKVTTEDGTACVIQYFDNPNCKTYCADITKNYDSCFQCLGNVNSCTKSGSKAGDQDTRSPCCTAVKDQTKVAMQCTQCMSRMGGSSVVNFESCLNDDGLSTGELIGIIAGTLVGVILIIVGVTLFIKSKNSKQSKLDLEETLVDKGASTRAVREIQALNLNNISSDTLNKVRQKESV
jgi:hypothetical protein